jgi:hypothetical protein
VSVVSSARLLASWNQVQSVDAKLLLLHDVVLDLVAQVEALSDTVHLLRQQLARQQQPLTLADIRVPLISEAKASVFSERKAGDIVDELIQSAMRQTRRKPEDRLHAKAQTGVSPGATC